jgi:hypothetical protein
MVCFLLSNSNLITKPDVIHIKDGYHLPSPIRNRKGEPKSGGQSKSRDQVPAAPLAAGVSRLLSFS